MLVKLEPLKDMVELVLQSSFIKPYVPVSLLLIAKPETAKTTVLTISRKTKSVFYTNEITAKMFIDTVFPLIEKGEIKTIVIPDLLNCIEKQKSTRQQFLNTIKSLIEEGFVDIQTYHKRFSSKVPLKASIITAITTVDFNKIRKYLENIGLLSRFIPFSYAYAISMIKAILEEIESENETKDASFKIVRTNKIIKGNRNLFKEFEVISTKLASQYSGHGFRCQLRLQHLAKANALLNGRGEINQSDIDKVIELSNWINFDFNII